MGTGTAQQRNQSLSATDAGVPGWHIVGSACVLVALCLLAYWRVHTFDYFNVDDKLYVFGDSRVAGPLNWSTVKWAFTHTFVLNYDPLTFLAHSLNVHLFGVEAGPHHVINVVLHALNAALLFWVLYRATGFLGRSFMVAALFAVHPVNIENVAWVAELKTLLSTAFFLIALGTYYRYVQRPSRVRMLSVAALYGMSLLAKPQAITFPFVLLLWDYWPLHRFGESSNDTRNSASFWKLVREKALLFFIAVGDSVITMFAEHKGDQPYTFLLRLGNAIFCYVKYIGKAIWPMNLSYLYPHPGYSLHWTPVWISLALLIAITALVLKFRDIGYLPVGWFWFLGTLFPMIGLIQIDAPAMADRYAYIPYIGLFIIACWSVADLAGNYRVPGFALRVASVALVALFALLTARQVEYWKDSFTMWSRSERVTERNWIAEMNVAGFLQDRGMLDDSLQHWLLAVEYLPGNVDLNRSTAFLEHRMKHYADAIHYYRNVLALSNDDRLRAQTWANMGHAYGALGDLEQERICYRNAQLIHPLPTPPPGGSPNRINWQGDWWHDLGPYFRWRLHLWKEQFSHFFAK
jgi:tetratricopeptide (TPR) repeat protein